MSVQRKALTAADFLSAEWLNGAMVILTEFYNAILGKSAHWYSHDTAFPALAILFILGGIVMIVRKNITIVPLLLITIAYVAAFTLSGSSYARHFPWYFAPILPITYLICSAGITSAMSALAKKLPSFPEKRISAVLCALAVIVWLTVSIGPLYSDAVALRYKESERERLYATTAVWAGKHIGNNVVVAADEIGAIGFFLPHEGMMLDMFGLLIRKDKLHVSFVQRIRDEQPHLICTKITYQNKKRIEAKIPGSYTWHRYRRMYVGIRSDLAASLEKFWPDFHRTHGTLYLDREYDWSSVITETSPSQKTMQKNGF